MSPHLTILRTYCTPGFDLDKVSPTVKLCHTDSSLTVFDLYPKSYFHFLLVPLILPPLRPENLRDLNAVLQLPREQAKAVLQSMKRDSLVAKALIEEEMVKQHGFKWDLQMGFHATPSMEYVPVPLKHLKHIHMHILSTEFLGRYMKSKRHINSFHPTLGFFLHIDEVLSWFEPDVEPTWFAMKSQLDKKMYDPLLKADLECPHCNVPFKSMPKLTDYMKIEFEELKKARTKDVAEAVSEDNSAATAPAESAESDEIPASTSAGAKRKHDDGSGSGEQSGNDDTANPDEPHPAKKRQTESSAGNPSSDS